MKAILSGIASALGANRAWLTLLLVATIGAGFYALWSSANARAERYAAWINVACAAAGTTWTPPAGSTLAPGADCQAELAALDRFRDDTTRVTAETLAKAAEDREGKLLADTARTRRAAEAARDAAQSMEDANAALKDNRVSGAWFDAFNHAAGLQPARR